MYKVYGANDIFTLEHTKLYDSLILEENTFPDGTANIRFKGPVLYSHYQINVDGKTFSRNPFTLALIVNAIREINNTAYIQLYAPYFPYAQQDRVCNYGEALSVKVMADFVNSLNFNKVKIRDPHSNVLKPLLNNVEIQSVLTLDVSTDSIVIAPDHGSKERANKFAENHGNLRVIYATKVRDSLTGDLSQANIKFGGSIKDKKLVIVDDICIGGRTFINLAKAIIERAAKYKMLPKSLQLFITHGIFIQGQEELKKYFDKITCTNSYNCEMKSTPDLEVINVFRE